MNSVIFEQSHLERHLQEHGDSRSWAYKNSWLKELTKQLAAVLKIEEYLADRAVLEIGAGVHNPLGSAICAIAQGATAAIAIEPGELAARHLSEALATSLFAAAGTNNLSEPRRTTALQHLKDVRDSLTVQVSTSIEAKGLDRTPIQNFGDTHLFNVTLESAKPMIAVDLFHSNAVLEHLVDLKQALVSARNWGQAGSIHVHKIDMIDHDYYSKTNPESSDAFAFLLNGSAPQNNDCNKLRLPQIERIFIDAGFDILAIPQRWHLEFPHHLRSKLSDEFAEFSDAEIGTVGAILIAKQL